MIVLVVFMKEEKKSSYPTSVQKHCIGGKPLLVNEQ